MDTGQAGHGSSPAPSGMGGSPSVRRGGGGGWTVPCVQWKGAVDDACLGCCVCVDWRRL